MEFDNGPDTSHHIISQVPVHNKWNLTMLYSHTDNSYRHAILTSTLFNTEEEEEEEEEEE